MLNLKNYNIKEDLKNFDFYLNNIYKNYYYYNLIKKICLEKFLKYCNLK